MIPLDIIAAAQAAERKWRVPASVSLAQWVIESGFGAHSPGNNCFGIKALPGQPCQTLMTTEHSLLRGYYRVPQLFRTFPTVAAAFDAHAALLATGKPYASAMAALPDVQAFITRMAQHYATDPLYASKLNAVIRQQDLAVYDRAGELV